MPAQRRTSEEAATPSAHATNAAAIRKMCMEEIISQARREKFLAVGVYDANGHRAGYTWRPSSTPPPQSASSNKSEDSRFCLQRGTSRRTQLIQKALKKMMSIPQTPRPQTRDPRSQTPNPAHPLANETVGAFIIPVDMKCIWLIGISTGYKVRSSSKASVCVGWELRFFFFFW